MATSAGLTPLEQVPKVILLIDALFVQNGWMMFCFVPVPCSLEVLVIDTQSPVRSSYYCHCAALPVVPGVHLKHVQLR